jgi:hypothetical protein
MGLRERLLRGDSLPGDIGRMPYWACARLEPRRERMALRFLNVRGFPVYWPQIGGKSRPRPLFGAYCFIEITLQWSPARWCPGVASIIFRPYLANST